MKQGFGKDMGLSVEISRVWGSERKWGASQPRVFILTLNLTHSMAWRQLLHLPALASPISNPETLTHITGYNGDLLIFSKYLNSILSMKSSKRCYHSQEQQVTGAEQRTNCSSTSHSSLPVFPSSRAWGSPSCGPCHWRGKFPHGIWLASKGGIWAVSTPCPLSPALTGADGRMHPSSCPCALPCLRALESQCELQLDGVRDHTLVWLRESRDHLDLCSCSHLGLRFCLSPV